MGNSCRLTPVVFQREGTRIVEKDSKLFKDIKDVVKNDDTAWKMWAYSKTAEFKKKYPDVNYDELGEVTFPSLIKALGLQDAYDLTKGIIQAAKDYGFEGKVFAHPEEAVQGMNDFNTKEDRFVAYINKVPTKDGYTVEVYPRDASTVQKAREQSYNNALTKEIIDLMNSLGFDVGFVNDPEYKGIFDPTNATMQDGLTTVINIARGIQGEEALPEEFAHFIIEGLINHPLVQRLLNSLDDAQLQEIFGDSYDRYFEKYNGEMLRMKKEAAGKLLAQHIRHKGTIKPTVMVQKRGLLSRIWNWAKGLFGKISDKRMADAKERAHDAISGIYNLVASGEGVPLFDKRAVLNGEQLYLLRENVNTAEKMAHKGMELAGRMIHSTRRKTMTGKVSQETADRFKSIAEAFDNERYAESLGNFLEDVKKNLLKVAEEKEEWAGVVKDAYVPKEQNVKDLMAIAGYVRSVQMLDDGYREMLSIMTTLDEPDNYKMFAQSPDQMDAARETGEYLAKVAADYLNVLNSLVVNKQETERRVLYMYSRTVYKQDRAQTLGKTKDEIMSLKMILEHADKDINFVDRWISALSDASDSFLPIIDSLVKNQQYERDMEMIEWKKQIALADKKLRDAGFTSDFMYERDSEGVPTGRIISQYDFGGWNEAVKQKRDELRAKYPDNEEEFRKEFRKWKYGATEQFKDRLVRVYINPEYQKLYQEGRIKEIPDDAIFEEVPNPEVFSKNINVLNSLAPAQREYYNTMMEIKHQMMMKIPHRGQGIYKAVYVSKDLVEGILDNSTGNPMRATLDYYRRHFVRRPDDIGFGTTEEFKHDVLRIMKEEKDNPKAAADRILMHLADSVDRDIFASINPKKIERIIKDKKLEDEEKVKKIIGTISAGTFYEVDTDFANHKIQRLPIYYTRRLKDMRMLSTDFTGTMVAYSAMAVNYEKMNEIVDIIEVARSYSKERAILENKSGHQSPYSMFQAFGKVFQGFVIKAGNGSNSAARLEDYINTVVYEQHKDDEGTFELLGVDLDTAKTLDAIKDYTGLLTLGLNAFSAISNITVGKVQQWIEAFGGEHFNVKDYALAVTQYGANIAQVVAEMASPLKHNKLSLLIEMFDPMKDYYESLKDTHNGNSIVSRILGNGALGYIGLAGGEHILRVQTMLACLNHIKLVNMDNPSGEKISLYDALEVVTDEEGVSRLELKPNLGYERDVIDNSGITTVDSSGKFIAANKNYGKPVRDENGKIKTELVRISDPEELREKAKKLSDRAYYARMGSYDPEDPEAGALKESKTYKNFMDFIFRKKKAMGKVNDSLNGAFSEPDKGAAHRKAIWRMILQFRQWMPAHYSRRFARAHYDGDLEQWREGYYTTVWRTMNQVQKDIRKAQFNFEKLKSSMSPHEIANFRRAEAEVGLFAMMFTLVRIGGRVKDRDRSWLDKMALYQIHRMYLEVGASMPGTQFFGNIIQMLNSPMAAISTLERVKKVMNMWDAFDEIETGRYQGWTELERNAFQLLPYMPQIWKAVDFDDSMFTMFERDD